MRFRRRKKPGVGHYFRKARTQDIWVCVADHVCQETRDPFGRVITTEDRTPTEHVGGGPKR